MSSAKNPKLKRKKLKPKEKPSNLFTQKWYDLYQREALKWISEFGLKEWEVYFYDQPPGVNNVAACDWDYPARTTYLQISDEWTIENPPNEPEIKKAAFHEVMELMFADIRELIEKYGAAREKQNSQMATQLEEDLSGEIHAVIRRFENHFYLQQPDKLRK